MKKRIISLLSPLLLVASASANWQPNDYIKRHCTGQKHHPLSTEVQIDCYTDSHVIKYDWDKDWLSSLSQVLLQSTLSGKKAGMMVLSTDAEQTRHINKLHQMVEKHQLPVDVWLVNPVKVSIVNISQLEKVKASESDSEAVTGAVAIGAAAITAGVVKANKSADSSKVKPVIINSETAKKRQVGGSTVKVGTPTGTKVVSSVKPSQSNSSMQSNYKSKSYSKASSTNKYKSSGKFYKSSNSRSNSNKKDYSKMQSQPSY